MEEFEPRMNADKTKAEWIRVGCRPGERSKIEFSYLRSSAAPIVFSGDANRGIRVFEFLFVI
jgi:hypothetical protein